MSSWWKPSSSTVSSPKNAVTQPQKIDGTANSKSQPVITVAKEDEERAGLDSERRIKALEDENRLLREALAKANHTTKPLFHTSDPNTLSKEFQSQRIIQQLSSELKATKAYLVQPDEYATADILSMIDHLNSHIENTAATINDLYESAEKVENWDVYEKPEFYQSQRDIVKKFLGKRVYDANTQIDETLYYRDPETPESPLPLLAALQSIMVKWCIQATDRFGPAGRDVDIVLNGIYDTIRKREEQAVVARWRVMTISSFNNHATSHIDLILRTILALLVVCGAKLEDPAPELVSSLRQKLEALKKEIVKLKSAMDIGVLSSDLELCMVDPGEVYNRNTMKDAYGGSKSTKIKQELVFCCVGVGLLAMSVLLPPCTCTQSGLNFTCATFDLGLSKMTASNARRRKRSDSTSINPQPPIASSSRWTIGDDGQTCQHLLQDALVKAKHAYELDKHINHCSANKKRARIRAINAYIETMQCLHMVIQFQEPNPTLVPSANETLQKINDLIQHYNERVIELKSGAEGQKEEDEMDVEEEEEEEEDDESTEDGNDTVVDVPVARMKCGRQRSNKRCTSWAGDNEHADIHDGE
ncbi:hypothetical protein CVT24_003493 [Panaeolus cyanescens]|uniref:Uncharacterized protein n=1 Tax=Panaeolus cyanescens TaxID=181874 RepID=A0A409Y7F7_9AGAR|nr:hypothetical protein CVT24_003493 [Panaeolus cyanescens]